MRSIFKYTSTALLAGFLFATPSILSAQTMDLADGLTIDFQTDARGDALLPGSAISEQYADWGVHIAAKNNRSDHPNVALVFDSSNPSGGDTDLGTPNAAFNGPGRGRGGNVAGGINNEALGNLLIIAENDLDANGDGFVDAPDDEAGGGKLIISFDEPVNILQLTLVDIDENERGAVISASHNGKSGTETPLKGLGDNSVVRFDHTNWSNITQFEITLPGSGAIGNLTFQTIR